MNTSQSNAKNRSAKQEMGVPGASRARLPHLKLGNDPDRARREPRPPAATSPSRLVAAKGRAKSYLALPKRTGFAAFEAMAAVAILALLLAIAGQMSGAMLHHRRNVERHRTAMDAKTNLMNIAMALPYDDTTPDRLETIAAEFTPDRASWQISVTTGPLEATQDEEPAERRQDTSFQPLTAKRIVIALHLTNSARRNVPNRPLVAWRYPGDPPLQFPRPE